MDSIITNSKADVPKVGKQMAKEQNKSLEAVLSSKHKKANEFIKRVKLSF